MMNKEPENDFDAQHKRASQCRDMLAQAIGRPYADDIGLTITQSLVRGTKVELTVELAERIVELLRKANRGAVVDVTPHASGAAAED